MPEICPRYAQDTHKICLRYAWDMGEICQRYAQDMPEICQRNMLKKLWQNVYYFYESWGKMSWGKMSLGHNVSGAKCPWGRMSPSLHYSLNTSFSTRAMHQQCSEGSERENNDSTKYGKNYLNFFCSFQIICKKFYHAICTYTKFC